MLPTAVGSMTTVHRPGLHVPGLPAADRLLDRDAAQLPGVQVSGQSFAPDPAHPEPVPSGVRMVVVNPTRESSTVREEPLRGGDARGSGAMDQEAGGDQFLGHRLLRDPCDRPALSSGSRFAVDS
jgi:hypothetical protein